ncbi:MAG: class I SAM-dependent methyltransferase [Sphingomonadaceae bacterium]|nr:class I SAM-dependent methyltransferase [Sphingomonadaceae bacterium]
MADHSYSTDFYDYIDAGSRSSARAVAQLVRGEMEIGSLLDIGAGHGAWAAEWMAAGVKEVLAVDGDYVDQDHLAVPKANFCAHDLLEPLELKRKFDLVQSLEVAEHLPEAVAAQFVDTIVRHGDVVLFSAAVPHQGGEHHVNEQPPEYWRNHFAERGYAAYDWLRPRLVNRRDVKAWYKYNSVLYANAEGAKRLSAPMRAACVVGGQKLPMGGDIKWHARRAMVRLIPEGLVKPVAMAKASVEAKFRSREDG